MAVVIREIPWTPFSDEDPRPLGRSVRHDDESKRYAHRAASPGKRAAVQHVATIGVLDQLAQGSCVGHAGTRALASHQVVDALPAPKPVLDHPYAVDLYSACERRDGGKGLPSEDEGTSGVTCGNELKARGDISGFTHTFSLDAALDALQESALMIGINWHTGGDSPDAHGIIKATVGDIRGGHEVLVDEFVPAGSPLGGGAVRIDGTPFGDGFIATEDMIGMSNSWSESYGYRGRMYMSTKDFGALLAAQGDVTVLAPLSVAPPVPSGGGATFPGSSAAVDLEVAHRAHRLGLTPSGWLEHHLEVIFDLDPQ